MTHAGACGVRPRVFVRERSGDALSCPQGKPSSNAPLFKGLVGRSEGVATVDPGRVWAFASLPERLADAREPRQACSETALAIPDSRVATNLGKGTFLASELVSTFTGPPAQASLLISTHDRPRDGGCCGI